MQQLRFDDRGGGVGKRGEHMKQSSWRVGGWMEEGNEVGLLASRSVYLTLIGSEFKVSSVSTVDVF